MFSDLFTHKALLPTIFRLASAASQKKLKKPESEDVNNPPKSTSTFTNKAASRIITYYFYSFKVVYKYL